MITSAKRETVNRTIDALRKNNMQAYYCETKEEARNLAASLMNEGDTVTHGGSVTLAQCGIPEMLRGGRYRYLDRNAPGLTREQVQNIYIQAFSADVYLTSSILQVWDLMPT